MLREGETMRSATNNLRSRKRNALGSVGLAINTFRLRTAPALDSFLNSGGDVSPGLLQPSTFNKQQRSNTMTQKVRIQLGFQRYIDQQLTTVAAAVIQGMTGNKAFPNPPVDLTAIQTALDNFNAA